MCPEARDYMLQLLALLRHTSTVERSRLPDEGSPHSAAALERLCRVTRCVVLCIARRHREPQSRHIREQSEESEKRVAKILKRWGHTPATTSSRRNGEVEQLDSRAVLQAAHESCRDANRSVFQGPLLEVVDHPEVGWNREAVAPVSTYMQLPPPAHRSKQASQWISRKRHRVEVGIFCPAKAAEFYSMGLWEEKNGSYVGVSCSHLLALSLEAHRAAQAQGLGRGAAAAASAAARSRLVVSCGPTVKPASRDLFAAAESELTRAGDYLQAVAVTNERILVESGSKSISACLEAMGGQRTESGGCRVTRTAYPPLSIEYARAMPRSTVFYAFGGVKSASSTRQRQPAKGSSLHEPARALIMKRPTKRGILCYAPLGRREMATPLHVDAHDAMYRVGTTRIPQWLRLRTWHTSVLIGDPSIGTATGHAPPCSGSRGRGEPGGGEPGGGRLLMVAGDTGAAREEVVAIGSEERLLEFFSGRLHGVEATGPGRDRMSINGRADSTHLRALPTFVDGFLLCDLGRLALSLCGANIVHYSSRTGLIQFGAGLGEVLGITAQNLRYALATSGALFRHVNGPNGGHAYMGLSRKSAQSNRIGCEDPQPRDTRRGPSPDTPPGASVLTRSRGQAADDWIQRESRTRMRTAHISALLGTQPA